MPITWITTISSNVSGCICCLARPAGGWVRSLLGEPGTVPSIPLPNESSGYAAAVHGYRGAELLAEVGHLLDPPGLGTFADGGIVDLGIFIFAQHRVRDRDLPFAQTIPIAMLADDHELGAFIVPLPALLRVRSPCVPSDQLASGTVGEDATGRPFAGASDLQVEVREHPAFDSLIGLAAAEEIGCLQRLSILLGVDLAGRTVLVLPVEDHTNSVATIGKFEIGRAHV